MGSCVARKTSSPHLLVAPPLLEEIQMRSLSLLILETPWLAGHPKDMRNPRGTKDLATMTRALMTMTGAALTKLLPMRLLMWCGTTVAARRRWPRPWASPSCAGLRKAVTWPKSPSSANQCMKATKRTATLKMQTKWTTWTGWSTKWCSACPTKKTWESPTTSWRACCHLRRLRITTITPAPRRPPRLLTVSPARRRWCVVRHWAPIYLTKHPWCARE
mmetsp:Transcript_6548/g.11009  ORF Transcript_6548/g.11009 Transcript_6548/m.11009 type:complete len:218 (-) Transcript_6548:784-1437(-)